MTAPRLVLGLATLFLLFAPAHGADQPTPKVLLIGIDGLRIEGLDAASTPHLDQLIADGCISRDAQTGDHTVSGPGWSSIMCGVWEAKHNVPDNDFRRPRYAEFPHFFTRLKEARPDLITASFITWQPLDQYLTTDANCDHRHFVDYEANGDARVTTLAEGVLADEPVDAVFFYLADVDVAGHEVGFHPAVPDYLAAIERADSQVGRLLAVIARRETYDQEDWLIIVTTDHGGTIDGNHGRNEPKHRRIPFIVSGSSAARGTIYPVPNQVDAPVTAIAHLGVAINPLWKLDGRPIGTRRAASTGANLLFNGDGEYSAGYRDTSENHGIPGWIDLGPMSLLEYGAVEQFPTAAPPGPDHRGRNFFYGGTAETDSSITQTVDVSRAAALIDAGDAVYGAGGDFGGFAEQRDLMTMHLTFLDSRDGTLGHARVGDVTVDERREAFGGEGEALTGFLRRTISGTVPPGTRRILVTLDAERHEGGNDGYADNLLLTIGASPQIRTGVAALHWLSGSWHLEQDGMVIEEAWTSAETDMMLGTNRVSAGDRTAMFEFMRITHDDSGITFHAQPRGREASPFAAIEVGDQRIVFENTEHDYPQKITYWRIGDVLHAVAEGDVDGTPRRDEWQWQRVH